MSLPVRTSSFRPFALSAAAVCVFLVSPGQLRAQASAAASRTLSLSVFAGGMRLQTDYGDHNYGVVFGADLTRHFRLLDAALEARATLSGQGNAVKEDTFSGGVRVGRHFNRFHPYAEFLIGEGLINFSQPTLFPSGPYSSDNSTVLSFGGGLDYDVARNFAVKADFSQQSWRLGSEQNRLTPAAYTVGIVYRIPFGGRVRR